MVLCCRWANAGLATGVRSGWRWLARGSDKLLMGSGRLLGTWQAEARQLPVELPQARGQTINSLITAWALLHSSPPPKLCLYPVLLSAERQPGGHG